MPLYEYKCLKCGRLTEKIEPVSGPHLKKCPHCGGKVENVLSAPAIQFKGSGWYVTDYAGKSKGGDSAETASGKETSKDGATKDTANKDKETSSKESSAKDKKPAKKK